MSYDTKKLFCDIGNLKLLVEIAIVNASDVVDAQRGLAHQVGQSLRVEVRHEQLHVRLQMKIPHGMMSHCTYDPI